VLAIAAGAISTTLAIPRNTKQCKLGDSPRPPLASLVRRAFGKVRGSRETGVERCVRRARRHVSDDFGQDSSCIRQRSKTLTSSARGQISQPAFQLLQTQMQLLGLAAATVSRDGQSSRTRQTDLDLPEAASETSAGHKRTPLTYWTKLSQFVMGHDSSL
jgi:hypothetical protein